MFFFAMTEEHETAAKDVIKALHRFVNKRLRVDALFTTMFI